jgi:hypothetical protein
VSVSGLWSSGIEFMFRSISYITNLRHRKNRPNKELSGIERCL